MADAVDELIEAGDVNGLLRAVDGACEARDWEALVDLADRCEDAIERGRQLWPIAAHIDYRLALEAPAEYAALALGPGAGRFAVAPLTEVAASTHTWAELAPHVDTPQVAAYVAQERVLRGENLTGDERAHADVLELPLELLTWEPAYALARFGSTYVEVAEPWAPVQLRAAELAPGPTEDDPELVDALLDLVQPWTTESNGAARAVVVAGDAGAAASHLALAGLRLGRIEPAAALRQIAWAAASGGAHGRRRGAALGRFLAWYTAGLVSGTEWPVEPAALEVALGRLRWFTWDEGAPEQGWVLRIAVEHPVEGWSAALGATDVLEDPDDEGGSDTARRTL